MLLDLQENGAGNENLARLLQKIEERSATVGIVGLGYVGLPLAVAFAEAGFRTEGFDTNPLTIETLQRGESHVADVAAERIHRTGESCHFAATADMSRLGGCDATIVCVPTPLTETREPNLDFVRSATDAIHRGLRTGQLVVLESTTYPGTTDEIVRPILEATGLRAGHDFFLAYSPERIDPGNRKFSFREVPKVVGGYTPRCLSAASALYGTIVERTVPVSSTQTAELTKLLENVFRSVNIALVNEMALLCDRMNCDRMNLDIWEVIEAAGTKPYGFTKFLPGPGPGGHCIPIDPVYLSWKARQYDFQTRFIELAVEVNHAMPQHVVDKIIRALNDDGKCVRNASIVLLGMSYKADIGDCRESPALRVADLLLGLGANLSYNDPYVRSVGIGERTLHSEPFTSLVGDADCVVLLTAHSDYDYAAIASASTLIVDTRDAFKAVKESKARIIKL